MTALGVLCCFALFVCLTLLASFFLPSHLSFKNMYMSENLSSMSSNYIKETGALITLVILPLHCSRNHAARHALCHAPKYLLNVNNSRINSTHKKERLWLSSVADAPSAAVKNVQWTSRAVPNKGLIRGARNQVAGLRVFRLPEKNG